jgi:hypothetical protein
MKCAAYAVLLFAVLGSSCLLTQAEIPREVAGVIVDSQTRRPVAWVKVSVELKRDAISGYGHTVKEWKTVVVAESEEDGRFAVDLGEYRDRDGKDKQGRTLRTITFEKDRYEPLVKQANDDLSRVELKPTPSK